MNHEQTIDELVNKDIRRTELIEKRSCEKGKALLFIKLEPILTLSKAEKHLKSEEFIEDPFKALGNFK